MPERRGGEGGRGERAGLSIGALPDADTPSCPDDAHGRQGPLSVANLESGLMAPRLCVPFQVEHGEREFR